MPAKTYRIVRISSDETNPEKPILSNKPYYMLFKALGLSLSFHKNVSKRIKMVIL